MRTLVIVLAVCLLSTISVVFSAERQPAQFVGDGGRFISGYFKQEAFDFVGSPWFGRAKVANNQAKFDLTGHLGTGEATFALLVVPVFTYEKEYQSLVCSVNGKTITLEAEGRGALIAPGTDWNKIIHKVYRVKSKDLVTAINSGNKTIVVDFPEFHSASLRNPWFEQYPTATTCYLLLGFSDPKAGHQSGLLATGPIVPDMLRSSIRWESSSFEGVKNQDIRVIASGYFLADPTKNNSGYNKSLLLNVLQKPAPGDTAWPFSDVVYYHGKFLVPSKEPGLSSDYLVDVTLKGHNQPKTSSLRPRGSLELRFGDTQMDAAYMKQKVSASFFCVLWASSLPFKTVSEQKQPATEICTVLVPGFCASMSSKVFGKEGDFTYSPLPGYKIKLNSDWKLDPINHTYDKLVDVLGKAPGGVELCGYDWRKTADEVVDEFLIPAIARAKAKTGQTQVQIVAHSTGNLVVFRYMTSSKYRQDISRWVAIAPPFRGSGNAYDIWNGANLNAYTLVGKLGYAKFIGDVMAKYSRSTDTLSQSKTVQFLRQYMPGLAGLLPCGNEFSVFQSKEGKTVDSGSRILSQQNLYATELTSSKVWKVIEDQLGSNLVVFLGTGQRTVTGINLRKKSRASSEVFGLEDGGYDLRFSNNGDGTVADNSASFLKKAQIIKVVGKHNQLPDIISAKQTILSP